MFEKEAEEWANKIYPSDGQAQRYLLMGAMFGYNKAKEEAKDIINELLMNGYNESTRDKALNFLYPDKEE